MGFPQTLPPSPPTETRNETKRNETKRNEKQHIQRESNWVRWDGEGRREKGTEKKREKEEKKKRRKRRKKKGRQKGKRKRKGKKKEEKRISKVYPINLHSFLFSSSSLSLPYQKQTNKTKQHCFLPARARDCCD